MRTTYKLGSISIILLCMIFIIAGRSNAQIFFPADHNGHVGAQVAGNILEIWGTWDNENPPDWKSLVDWTESNCATIDLIEAWDCGNPERHGTISLFFYFRILVKFSVNCRDTVCFWAEHDLRYGEVCINSSYLQYSTIAELRDRCGDKIKHRSLSDVDLVDLDEYVIPYGELKTNKAVHSSDFPDRVFGHFYVDGDSVWITPLYLVRSDTIHAIYQAENWQIWLWPGHDTLDKYDDLAFSLPYGRYDKFHFTVDQAKFSIDSLIYVGNLPLSGNYGKYAVCFPDGADMQFGVRANIGSDFEGWPTECYPPGCAISGIEDEDTLITTCADEISGPSFVTTFDQSSYPINGYKEDTIFFNWDAVVENPWGHVLHRPLEPTDPPTNLRVFHAFRADPIRFIGEEPAVIEVGDSITYWATPYPFLLVQPRIIYAWHVSPSNRGHFEYAYANNYQRNTFIAADTGTSYLYYTITDTSFANYFTDTSAYKEIYVGPASLRITSPAPNSKFTFSDSSVGIIDTFAIASVTPPLYKDSVHWSITPVTGMQLNYSPSDSLGDTIHFCFNGLPDSNKYFGNKYIKASLPRFNLAESVLVKVFFPTWAKNNPEAGIDSIPNWYYYWGQTPANIEPDIYSGPYCNDTTYGYFRHRWYSAAESVFHACDNASLFNLSPGYPSRHSGIDCFGEVCMHENKHYSNWWDWWGSHLYDSTYADRDSDFIPSVIEPALGLDSLFRDSSIPPDGIDDEEELAYREMRLWIVGKVDTLDWSQPGHQY